MSSLTELSCRVCLSECSTTSKNYEEFALIFEYFFKVQYCEEDIPKKLCRACVRKIINIEIFYKTCKETEKVLEENRIVDASQVLYTDFVKIECEEVPEYVSAFPLDTLLKDEASLTDNELFPAAVKESTTVAENKPEMKMCCDICGKQVNAQYMKQHLLQHPDKIKVDTFYCDMCDYLCHVKYRIGLHMRKKHLKTIHYNCEYCSRTYQDGHSLKFHISSKHTGKYPHNCTVCSMGFMSAHRLSVHMAKHSNVRLFNCDICGYACKTTQYLKRHRRDVHSDKKLPCGECGKTFKNLKLLGQHKQGHKPHVYKCFLCDRTYVTVQPFRIHLQKVHPHLPVALSGSNLRHLKGLDDYLRLCM